MPTRLKFVGQCMQPQPWIKSTVAAIVFAVIQCGGSSMAGTAKVPHAMSGEAKCRTDYARLKAKALAVIRDGERVSLAIQRADTLEQAKAYRQKLVKQREREGDFARVLDRDGARLLACSGAPGRGAEATKLEAATKAMHARVSGLDRVLK